MGFLSKTCLVLKWVSSLLAIHFYTLIRSSMCKMHHFWIRALLHCYKYHVPIIIRAYKLYVLNYMYSIVIWVELCPYMQIYLSWRDIMLCWHTQIHTHTHTYKHTTSTCTNICLVYYSQHNVMKYLYIYIFCR
jgi:hypothetical protein